MLDQFEINLPVIQAPMAGVTTPNFVVACCEAGILGFIGAGYLSAEDTRRFIQQVKNRTDKPFGVNVFIQDETKIDQNQLQQAKRALHPIYEELNISVPLSVPSNDLYREQIEVILAEEVRIVSFTFGLPSEADIARFKARGTYLIGTATTTEEALAVQAAGLDAVVMQGSEAGGHRGTFLAPFEFIELPELLQQVQHQVSIPVIAAGGIVTATQATEAFANGATAIQVGTALIMAEECEVNAFHKEAIMHSQPMDTCITTAFTGKPARGLKNAFTERLKDAPVAPYPIQHYLTSSIRQTSIKKERPEFLSLWMGQNSYLASKGTVTQIIARILEE